MEFIPMTRAERKEAIRLLEVLEKELPKKPKKPRCWPASKEILTLVKKDAPLRSNRRVQKCLKGKMCSNISTQTNEVNMITLKVVIDKICPWKGVSIEGISITAEVPLNGEALPTIISVFKQVEKLLTAKAEKGSKS